jgi:hypothetical protein
VAHFKKKIFDEWPLQNGDTMRVSVDHYGGRDLVHVRRWRRGPNGQLYPTDKGAAIRIDQVRRLMKALKAIRAHARKIGVLPPRSRSR